MGGYGIDDGATSLLTVTTRSKLRGARFFPAMLVATLRIRRQLRGAPGLVRWASVIAGPTEFWTVTVWRSRHAMQEFARCDAHGRLMWRSSRWLDSLWLMRWRPGPCERGSWGGMTLASAARRRTGDGLTASPGTAAARTSTPLPEQVLAAVPDLRAAMGGGEAATYDASPLARGPRRQVAGGGGAVVRFRGGSWRTPTAYASLAALRRRLRRADPALLRAVVGFGRPGEVYFLGLWRTQSAASAFLRGEWIAAAAARWGDRLWAGCWEPEHEFGHWDGVRLRRTRRDRVTDATPISGG